VDENGAVRLEDEEAHRLGEHGGKTTGIHDLATSDDETHRTTVLSLSDMSTQAGLRCRLGLHRWVRMRTLDPSLANPGRSATSRTECRDCHAERGSGIRSTLVLVAVLAVGSAVVGITFSPVLGGLLLVGAVMGLAGAMKAKWVADRFDRGGRYRR
jgi:hypothetical protein